MRSAPLKTACLIFSLLGLSGCAVFGDAPHYRGIALSPHDLDELTPGTSSQADATALLGPPTFQEQFDNNNWIYVSQITKMRIGQTEGVMQQRVVQLTFDNNGVLQKMTQKDLRDGVTVAMDTHQTPVPGGSAGFFQQLLGGTGYNPLGSVTGANSANPSTNGLGSGGGGISSSGTSGIGGL